MRDWKNILGGICVALGTALINGGDGWVEIVGTALLGLGGLLVDRSAVASGAKSAARAAGKARRLLVLLLCISLVCAPMVACKTTTTEHPDGSVIVEREFDSERALQAAQRALELAMSAYQYYCETEGWESDRANYFLDRVEHWTEIIDSMKAQKKGAAEVAAP